MESESSDPRIVGVIRLQRKRALAHGGSVVSTDPALKRPLVIERPTSPSTVQEEVDRSELAVAQVPKLELPECEYAQDDLEAIDDRHDELANLKRRCLWLLKQTVALETERQQKKKSKSKSKKKKSSKADSEGA